MYFSSRDAALEQRQETGEEEEAGTPAREGAVWGLPETDAGFLLEQWCDVEITKVGNMAAPSHRLQGLWGAASQRNLGGGVDVQFMKTVTAACETKWCPPVENLVVQDNKRDQWNWGLEWYVTCLFLFNCCPTSFVYLLSLKCGSTALQINDVEG